MGTQHRWEATYGLLIQNDGIGILKRAYNYVLLIGHIA